MTRIFRIRGAKLHIWFPPLGTLGTFIFLTAAICGLLAYWYVEANPRIILIQSERIIEPKFADIRWEGVGALKKVCPIGSGGWQASYLDD